MIIATTPFFAAFIVSLFFYPRWIAFLTRKQLTQHVRFSGPPTHQTKGNTPTFGGVGILLSLIVSLLPFILTTQNILKEDISGKRIILSLFILVIGTGVVGLLDDWMLFKNKSGETRGLKARYKLAGQLLAGILFLLCYLPGNTFNATTINIPEFFQIISVNKIDLGYWFIPFFLITLMATTNAVNLTDGQDGLAAGTTFIALLYFITGFYKFPAIEQFVWGLMGSCIGFLWFNVFPARIFMGDTGSLALGAALTGLAFIVHEPFILLWIGGVFVAETLSVILQVIYFKLTKGKRIFKMSPLHHHFELSGIPETHVTIRFWIAGIFLTLSGIAFHPIAGAW